MAKVAVILSGCGFMDGSEIHESVLVMLALARKKHAFQCFAPDIPQARVVNHLTGEHKEESRNVLEESARITRGKVASLKDLDVAQFDALVLPGGFGAALNLSDFAEKGVSCSVHPDLKRVITQAHEQKKAIGATCITPAAIAKIFQEITPLTMTLGSDPKNNEQLEKMGMCAKTAAIDEVVEDKTNRIYTTPCYMEPPDLAKMFTGISKLVDSLV